MKRVLVDVCLVHVFDDVDLTELIGYKSARLFIQRRPGTKGYSHLSVIRPVGTVRPGLERSYPLEVKVGVTNPTAMGGEIISVKSLIPDAGVYSLQKAGQTDGP